MAMDSSTKTLLESGNLYGLKKIFIQKTPAFYSSQTDNTGNTLLHTAVIHDHPHIVAWLLSIQRENILTRLSEKNNKEENSFHLAAKHNSVWALRALLSTLKTRPKATKLVYKKNKAGKSPIEISIESGHHAITNLLIANCSEFTNKNQAQIFSRKNLSNLSSKIFSQTELLPKNILDHLKEKPKLYHISNKFKMEASLQSCNSNAIAIDSQDRIYYSDQEINTIYKQATHVNPEKWLTLGQINSHKKHVTSMCHLINDYLAVGLNNGEIQIWKNKDCVYTIKNAHTNEIKHIIKLPGKVFASTSKLGPIKLWGFPNGEHKLDVGNPTEKVSALIASADGDIVYSVGGIIHKYNIQARAQSAVSPEQSTTIQSLLLLYNGQIASGNNAGEIKLWNNSLNKIQIRLHDKNESIVLSLAQTASNDIISGHQNGSIKIWDATEKKCIRTIKTEAPVTKLLSSPSSRLICSLKNRKMLIYRTGYLLTFKHAIKTIATKKAVDNNNTKVFFLGPKLDNQQLNEWYLKESHNFFQSAYQSNKLNINTAKQIFSMRISEKNEPLINLVNKLVKSKNKKIKYENFFEEVTTQTSTFFKETFEEAKKFIYESYIKNPVVSQFYFKTNTPSNTRNIQKSRHFFHMLDDGRVVLFSNSKQKNKDIQIFSPNLKNKLKTIALDQENAYVTAAYSTGDNHVILGHANGTISIWDMHRHRLVNSQTPKDNSAKACICEIKKFGDILVTRSTNSATISKFKLSNGYKKITSLPTKQIESPSFSLKLCPKIIVSESVLLLSNLEAEFEIWNIDQATLIKKIKSYKSAGPRVLCSLSDGNIAIGKRDGGIDIVKISSDTIFHIDSIKPHSDAILAIDQLRTGYIVSSSLDCTTALYDLTTKKIQAQFKDSHPAFAVAATKDGGILTFNDKLKYWATGLNLDFDSLLIGQLSLYQGLNSLIIQLKSAENEKIPSNLLYSNFLMLKWVLDRIANADINYDEFQYKITIKNFSQKEKLKLTKFLIALLPGLNIRAETGVLSELNPAVGLLEENGKDPITKAASNTNEPSRKHLDSNGKDPLFEKPSDDQLSLYLDEIIHNNEETLNSSIEQLSARANDSSKTFKTAFDNFKKLQSTSEKLQEQSREEVSNELENINNMMQAMLAKITQMESGHKVLIEEYKHKAALNQHRKAVLAKPSLASFYKQFQLKLNAMFIGLKAASSGFVAHQVDHTGNHIARGIALAGYIFPVPIVTATFRGFAETIELKVRKIQEKQALTGAQGTESLMKLDNQIEFAGRSLAVMLQEQILKLDEFNAAKLADYCVGKILSQISSENFSYLDDMANSWIKFIFMRNESMFKPINTENTKNNKLRYNITQLTDIFVETQNTGKYRAEDLLCLPGIRIEVTQTNYQHYADTTKKLTDHTIYGFRFGNMDEVINNEFTLINNARCSKNLIPQTMENCAIDIPKIFKVRENFNANIDLRKFKNDQLKIKSQQDSLLERMHSLEAKITELKSTQPSATNITSSSDSLLARGTKSADPKVEAPGSISKSIIAPDPTTEPAIKAPPAPPLNPTSQADVASSSTGKKVRNDLKASLFNELRQKATYQPAITIRETEAIKKSHDPELAKRIEARQRANTVQRKNEHKYKTSIGKIVKEGLSQQGKKRALKDTRNDTYNKALTSQINFQKLLLSNSEPMRAETLAKLFTFKLNELFIQYIGVFLQIDQHNLKRYGQSSTKWNYGACGETGLNFNAGTTIAKRFGINTSKTETCAPINEINKLSISFVKALFTIYKNPFDNIALNLTNNGASTLLSFFARRIVTSLNKQFRKNPMHSVEATEANKINVELILNACMDRATTFKSKHAIEVKANHGFEYTAQDFFDSCDIQLESESSEIRYFMFNDFSKLEKNPYGYRLITSDPDNHPRMGLSALYTESLNNAITNNATSTENSEIHLEFMLAPPEAQTSHQPKLLPSNDRRASQLEVERLQKIVQSQQEQIQIVRKQMLLQNKKNLFDSFRNDIASHTNPKSKLHTDSKSRFKKFTSVVSDKAKLDPFRTSDSKFITLENDNLASSSVIKSIRLFNIKSLEVAETHHQNLSKNLLEVLSKISNESNLDFLIKGIQRLLSSSVVLKSDVAQCLKKHAKEAESLLEEINQDSPSSSNSGP